MDVKRKKDCYKWWWINFSCGPKNMIKIVVYNIQLNYLSIFFSELYKIYYESNCGSTEYEPEYFGFDLESLEKMDVNKKLES